MARVFFMGDIVGRPGREAIRDKLGRIVQKEAIDCVIANGENAAGGDGITGKITEELVSYGIDGITLGDHVWGQKGFSDEIDKLEKICRPANLPKMNPGKEHLIIGKKEFRLGVFTVLGRVFMGTKAACPFETVDRKVKELGAQVDGIIVEIHAEATSEKIALGRYLDGRVLMVVGTHTHIATADAQILPRGTAYITDLGMTGPYDSVLGVETEIIIKSFQDGLPRRFDVAKGPGTLSGVIIDFNVKLGLAEGIRLVSF